MSKSKGKKAKGRYPLNVIEKQTDIKSSLPVVQDHARQFGDFTLVYPVISRRSRGLSIGINLNPDKVCNFDCVYCEVDRTTPGKTSRVDLQQLHDELTRMVHFVRSGRLAEQPKFREVPQLAGEIRDFAFSGDGEPTLVRNFAACAQVVAEVKRMEKLSRTRLVLITDAAGLNKADVKRGLEILDRNQGEVWGKLDAGTEDYFKRINRTTVRFQRILNNLLETAKVRPIVIQSMFLKMHEEPPAAAELHAYCSRLTELTAAGAQIKEVHAYTLARPAPEPFVTRLSKAELEAIGRLIRQETGLRVQTFE
jgi:wyosine [tRNA(Phe)-imidazoG37] synthetase (radical SAM superfamily)